MPEENKKCGENEKCGTFAPHTTSQLTPHQTNALSIMRCYFMSYANPHSYAWEAGMETAVRAYGRQRGPGVAWACLKCVQEMRVSRKTTFRFCNPFCKCCRDRLTQHELHLVESIEHAGQGARGPLMVTSMMLCEGNNDLDFVRSLETLNEAVAASQTTQT